eukprot:GHRR01030182.1.p1 GENE.GHRR01030182.1~~GHRR01030182.1.p1  ORF type:complete len:173 (+),score=4.14 GHRR01030182.1:1208-1726(+)
MRKHTCNLPAYNRLKAGHFARQNSRDSFSAQVEGVTRPFKPDVPVTCIMPTACNRTAIAFTYHNGATGSITAARTPRFARHMHTKTLIPVTTHCRHEANLLDDSYASEARALRVALTTTCCIILCCPLFAPQVPSFITLPYAHRLHPVFCGLYVSAAHEGICATGPKLSPNY